MTLLRNLGNVYNSWKKKRQLNAYYSAEQTKPKGEWFFRYLLVFLIAVVGIFWQVPRLNDALLASACVILLLFIIIYTLRQKELNLLRFRCHEKIALQEFKKRLDKTTTFLILQVLGDAISKKFPVTELSLVDNHLEGLYGQDNLAVYYIPLSEEDTLETKDVIAILRECRQGSIKKVRIFINGDYGTTTVNSLVKRYDLDLKIYDVEMMSSFLKETVLYPSESEIIRIARKESEKRNRSLMIIKKQALQHGKYVNYFLSSLTLFCLAWFNIGLVYVNLVFGVFLFLLGIISLFIQFIYCEKELTF